VDACHWRDAFGEPRRTRVKGRTKDLAKSCCVRRVAADFAMSIEERNAKSVPKRGAEFVTVGDACRKYVAVLPSTRLKFGTVNRYAASIRPDVLPELDDVLLDDFDVYMALGWRGKLLDGTGQTVHTRPG